MERIRFGTIFEFDGTGNEIIDDVALLNEDLNQVPFKNGFELVDELNALVLSVQLNVDFALVLHFFECETHGLDRLTEEELVGLFELELRVGGRHDIVADIPSRYDLSLDLSGRKVPLVIESNVF